MKRERGNAELVLYRLKELYPNPHHYLEFDGPFQLLVATILSAQCTDEKVNAVTPGLFRRYPHPGDFAAEDIGLIEEAVRPTGFYRNKARAIKGASEAIVERFGGKVPGNMDDLVTLPGIARKSANAILQHGFSKVSGVVVDTHVIRVSKRLGWTGNKDPAKIEQDLMDIFDRREWKWIPYYLKKHGRSVCRAPNPRCTECPVSPDCPSAATGTGISKKLPGKSTKTPSAKKIREGIKGRTTGKIPKGAKKHKGKTARIKSGRAQDGD